MDNCSVPNCKLKSSSNCNSLHNKIQLVLWRKVLKNNSTNFGICDQHISIICQCCTKSFSNKQYISTGNMNLISDKFQVTFWETIGCEIPVGVVCSKCYKCINDFAKFRSFVRKQQEQRIEYSEITQETQVDEEQDEYQVKQESSQDEYTEYDENAEYEVVEYQDEEYIVEMKEPDENDEVRDVEVRIKQEQVEYEELQIKSEPMDDDDTSASNSYSQHESPEAIVKVEPVEYEYLDQDFQIPSEDLQTEIESQTPYFPRISNPRTIPANLKRKISSPEVTSVSTVSPKSVQGSLRSALESSKQMAVAAKRMKFPQGSLKCQYCPEKFDHPDLILEHIENKHKFQCSVCNTSFPFKINLIHHQFMNHKGSSKSQTKKISTVYSYACGKCMKKFSSSQNLDIHMKQEHNGELKGLGIYGDKDKTPPSLSSRILNSFKKAQPGPSGIKNIKKES